MHTHTSHTKDNRMRHRKRREIFFEYIKYACRIYSYIWHAHVRFVLRTSFSSLHWEWSCDRRNRRDHDARNFQRDCLLHAAFVDAATQPLPLFGAADRSFMPSALCAAAAAACRAPIQPYCVRCAANSHIDIPTSTLRRLPQPVPIRFFHWNNEPTAVPSFLSVISLWVPFTAAAYNSQSCPLHGVADLPFRPFNRIFLFVQVLDRCLGNDTVPHLLLNDKVLDKFEFFFVS